MRALIVATLALIWSAPGLALDPDRLPTQYVHDFYSRADGLPAGAVWSLNQDSDGYLWLGTQNGLARFDGARFTIFDASNTPGMSSQDIRDVLIDDHDQLWLGSYGGGVYRFDGARVEVIGLEQGLPHNVVYDLLLDREGALWIGTAGGLARLDSDRTLTVWTQADGLPNDRIFTLFQGDEPGIWLGTFGGGIAHFDGTEFRVWGRSEGLASDQIHSIFSDRDGRTLVGTYDGGFHAIESGRVQALTLPDGLPGIAIQSMLKDGNGNLWLGSYGNGLIRFRDGDIAHLNEAELEAAVVSDMLEDAEGSLWLATRTGLQRLRDGKFTVFGQPEGLADSTFVVTGGEHSDQLWVGTEGHGLFHLTGGRIDRRLGVGDGLASENISALAVAPDGVLWAASFGAGLNRIDGDDVRIFDMTRGLPSNHIFAVEFGRDERLWVASAAGISTFDGDSIRSLTAENGVPGAAIRQLFADRSGRIWLGSNGRGLALLEAGELSVPAFNDRLPGGIAHAFHEDEAGRVWIGFRDGGLALWSEPDTLTHFGTEQGLPTSSVNAIQQDRIGHLWLASSSGLIRVSIEQLLEIAEGARERVEPTVFDESDGLRSIQFAGGFQPTSWQDGQGRLWFASTGGLVQVDPQQLGSNDRPPPVRIEDLAIDGVFTEAQGGIELPPETVNLEIHYTGLSLVAPEKVLFRYRLLGYDREWQEVGTRRTAYYTGLPNGRYTFQVLARNNDGIWSPEPARLDIVQLARTREQPWFIALCVLLGLMLVAALARLWFAQYRKREQRLSDQVRERTLQLEQALEEVERASRIDGLTGVANRGYFEEQLDRNWARARAEQHPLGLLMVDIDRFKQLNDRHGHQLGDDALRRVAQTLTHVVHRSGDLVARYGGEEFVVLLPDADLDAVGQLGEAMRKAVSSLEVGGAPPPQPPMTVSVGGASVLPGSEISARDLVGMADDALYRAKRNGRNRVELSD
jgi:diguanylate cyclase (GGDEF)-like protein